jgi:WD40 repeat protein
MLHLEFPPEHVHVAFTALPPSTTDFVSDSGELALAEPSRFAVMGDYGNCVNVYDARTFIVQHQIAGGHQLRQFTFANNNRELVVMTNDCRVRFYSLARYEGILLREISAVHRGSITTLSVSANSGYFITGGEDAMLKVWDYEAQKTLPYFFQAFIGHTYPVQAVMFCPSDNTTVMSCGDKDGIYLWTFHGDVRTQFAHQAEHDGGFVSVLEEETRPKGVLERIRDSKKEAKY